MQFNEGKTCRSDQNFEKVEDVSIHIFFMYYKKKKKACLKGVSTYFSFCFGMRKMENKSETESIELS